MCWPLCGVSPRSELVALPTVQLVEQRRSLHAFLHDVSIETDNLLKLVVSLSIHITQHRLSYCLGYRVVVRRARLTRRGLGNTSRRRSSRYLFFDGRIVTREGSSHLGSS